MRKLRFGRTGIMVPAVSLGTWGHGGPNLSGEKSVGWSGHDDRLASEALVAAWQAGITHWDTADVYGRGHAEALIGAIWDRVPPDDIFLATKVGWDPGKYGHFYHPEQMRSQLEASLENLRRDRIDLHYFHHCDFGPDDQYFDDALETMKRFQKEGKVRFIGLSDWDSTKIMRFIDRVDPDVVQPYRNVIDDAYESSGLKSWVDEHDIGVAFFSPLRHGLLLGKYTEPVTFPRGDFRENVADFGDAARIRLMQENRDRVKERFSSHPEPVLHALVGALLADAPTATVLLGQRNPEQVRAASRVGDPLSVEDATWVKSLYR